MTNRKYRIFTAVSLLSLLVIVTSVFVFAFTFGGDSNNPDASMYYTGRRVIWTFPERTDDVATLTLFGEPEQGEEHPLIMPGSHGEYYIRFYNAIYQGPINYTFYLYCDNPLGAPLSFDIDNVTKPEGTTKDVEYIPKSIGEDRFLAALGGTLDKKKTETFKITWEWPFEAESEDINDKNAWDERDTAIGNAAVNPENDSLYTFRLMLVIEDNNIYKVGTGSGEARILHRAYVKGYPEGDFRPEGNMTRAETSAIFARILANYDESKLDTGVTSFGDVPIGQWYAKYISMCEYSRLINGYPDGTFKPDGSITRAEFAALCVRYYEKCIGEEVPTDNELGFSDLDTSHWAYEILQKAVECGYINGYPDGTVKPDSPIRRSEVVTVVNRLLERSPDKEFIDKNMRDIVRFTDLTDTSYWAFYEICEASTNHIGNRALGDEIWVEIMEHFYGNK